MTDRKAAREFAATGINKWENEEMNLRAAFLEAESELEQEREAAARTEKLLVSEMDRSKFYMHRASDLQRRLEEVEATTIERCAAELHRIGDRNKALADTETGTVGFSVMASFAAAYFEAETAIRALSAQPNAAAGREHLARYGIHSEGQPLTPYGVQLIDDLAALVRRLRYQLKKHDPDNQLVAQADEYLRSRDLQGNPLRDDAAQTDEQGRPMTYWGGKPNAAAEQEVKLNGGAPETEVPSSTLGGPAPSAAPDPALPGLELALGLFAEDTWGAKAIRAEIARRSGK